MDDYKDLTDYELELLEENKALRMTIDKLDQQNTTMLRLIHANDQKQALMEASPEFAEAMGKIDGQS